MNTNNETAPFTTFILSDLGFGHGCVAVAYCEAFSVSGTVARVTGETALVGLFRVLNANGEEVTSRTFRNWDRARVARDVAASMAEYGVSF